ncbi:MAG TPA: hypothetical protein VFE25_15420 [Opitutaceae bacterium]|jgi:hypothetical protein|nr:hypothetical protein [Opitutaceae bacterium]
MKTKTPSLNFLAVGSAVLLAAAGCTKTATVAAAPTPTPAAVTPSAAVVAQPVPAQPTPIQGPSAPVTKTSVGVPSVPFQADQASVSWASIKDYTFDQRSSFISGASMLEAQLGNQIGELNSKRAALPSTVDTKDWDFAMNNLVEAQSYFKSTVDEAAHTTPEFWNQEKDKVDAAWQKAEDQFDKVRTSTTF